MRTSEIDFGHLVSRENRNFKNRKTSSRLAESAWRAAATSAARPVEFGRACASNRPKSAVSLVQIHRKSAFFGGSVIRFKLIYTKYIILRSFSSQKLSARPRSGFKVILND